MMTRIILFCDPRAERRHNRMTAQRKAADSEHGSATCGPHDMTIGMTVVTGGLLISFPFDVANA